MSAADKIQAARTPIAPVAWRIQYLSSCGMPCGEIFFTEDPEIVERHQSRGACEVTPLYRAAADLADAQAQENARLRSGPVDPVALLKALSDLDAWVTDWLGKIHTDITDEERSAIADEMGCDWFGSGFGAIYRDKIAEARAALGDAP